MKQQPRRISPIALFFLRCLLVALTLTGTSRSLSCQVTGTATKKPIRFEVISVREREGYDRPNPLRLQWTPTGYIAEGIPLQWVVGAAYDVRFELVTGLPSWATSKRFDIFAKVAPSDFDAFSAMSNMQKNMMLMQIIVDRFHLKAHTEEKLSPAFDLGVSKGGLKISAIAATASSLPANTPQTLTLRPGEIKAKNITLGAFAGALWNVAGRKVVDKTMTSGLFAFTLKWTPDSEYVGATQRTSTEPPLSTALPEQLGLELRPSQAPIHTVVVDHVEYPTAN